MTDLSILIPARNEMFLARTIQDILEHKEGDTEVIAILDGQWTDPPIPQHPDVTIVYFPESIGQRAATNVAARLSNAKYLMKIDAHCAFDQGFDVKMMADMQDDWTMVPIMKNLHVFDWVCPNGHRRYQGPSGVCHECGEPTERDIVWISKNSPKSTSYRFDNTLHFQYFPEYAKRPEAQGDISETMSLQGSCFMVTRYKYWELDLCDENHGSWGQQGVEVACKTWLSGGRVVCNKRTWYAHMFRTQGGDFGFPYPNPGVGKAREYSRNLFLNGKWDKAKYPLSWLIEKFAPVPDWEKSWGVLYYTDNKLDPEIMAKCQKQLRKCIGQHRIVSVSLEPINFGENIVLPFERGYLTMFKQILAGLKELKTDYVFFAEHDILYHPSHFFFVPAKDDIYYYNTNVWKIRMSDGHGLYVDDCKQLSGICANRLLLIDHYEKRIKLVEEKGFSRAMGFEPGTHGREERVDDYKAESFKSQWPIIDLRHNNNLTQSRWTKEEFRNQRFTDGWKEQDNIPGWGHLSHFWKKI
jgi:glycosyltransferase involved in cell wall biosynthesis